MQVTGDGQSLRFGRFELLLDAAIARAEGGRERWRLAELLRIKGELLRMDGSAAAERCFAESLEEARRQQALSWELRTATSLARLRRDQSRNAEARDLLGGVHARFREGHATADLRAAKGLLDALA